MRNYRTIALGVILTILVAACQTTPGSRSNAPAANVRVAGIFADNMVLQRGIKTPIWGWAAPGGAVTVQLDSHTARAVAGPDGKWTAKLGPLSAGGPYTLTISGQNTVTFKNVMVGDVWLCSGQSNMAMTLQPGPEAVFNVEKELATANNPAIRLMTVAPATSFTPKDDLQGVSWRECTPETAKVFSAVGYFFGREIQARTGVPVGLINSSVGGTPAEAWTSADALSALPDYHDMIVRMPEMIRQSAGAVAEYDKAVAAWDAALDGRDAGYADGKPAWVAPKLEAADWKPMNLPTHWEDAGYPNLDGFMWLRKEVDIPPDWNGQPLKLGLGTINDMDRAWFNGTLVGKFELLAGWMKPREYDVPRELVKPGRAVIAVRVYDIGNKGGICGLAKDMWLRPASHAESGGISLAGEWQCKIGLDLAKIAPKPTAPEFRTGNFVAPTVLYNAMIAPLVPYGIRGAIWYQGESNAGRAYQYRALFPAMIEGWRNRWGQGDFPFLYVQLANFLKTAPEPVPDPWAELREAQSMTLSLPKTGMAVIIDIGDADNIHPRNKQDVGRRLALAARRVAYGEQLVYSGPLYKSMRVEEKAVRIQFTEVGGGLQCKGASLQGFAIAGSDQKFYWADARIDGASVVVSSAKVPNPVAVRYAWASNPVCNLFNAEGLPASPFRTDQWTGMTEGKR